MEFNYRTDHGKRNTGSGACVDTEVVVWRRMKRMRRVERMRLTSIADAVPDGKCP
jgi:hypothetical protein